MDSLNYLDKKLKLQGWIAKKRDHGKLQFFELRDHSSSIQVVCKDLNIDQIPLESVVELEGLVVNRESHTINPSLKLGKIEIHAESIKVLNPSLALPFHPGDEVNEELQLKYRFLYLRSQEAQRNIRANAELRKFLRDYMEKHGFLEINTPLLTANSPEGANPLIVLSRLYPGQCYALPQSPQIYKQIAMCSGIARYYQIAPCFRDEKPRSDRCSGSFYQLDVEMSFVDEKDVTNLLVDLGKKIIEKFSDLPVFVHKMTYDEAIKNYGTDKPDLRIKTEIHDCTKYFLNSELKIFKKKIQENNFVVKAIPFKELNGPEMEKRSKELGFNIAWASLETNNESISIIRGPIKNFITDSLFKELNSTNLVFICEKEAVAIKHCHILLREQKLPKEHHLILINKFPMYCYEDNKLSFEHNPFSKRIDQKDYKTLVEQYKVYKNNGETKLFSELLSEILKIKACQFDLVLNGFEIASGSIRENLPKELIENFQLCGYELDEINKKFGGLISALSYGAPPHGGFAIGIERLLMILLDCKNIREVEAFPLSSTGKELILGAPSKLEPEHLHLLTLN